MNSFSRGVAGFFVDFFRAMLCISAAYAVMRCVSVCLSRSCIVSKRINISSIFFTVG